MTSKVKPVKYSVFSSGRSLEKPFVFDLEVANDKDNKKIEIQIQTNSITSQQKRNQLEKLIIMNMNRQKKGNKKQTLNTMLSNVAIRLYKRKFKILPKQGKRIKLIQLKK